jgi:hypothetical protein
MNLPYMPKSFVARFSKMSRLGDMVADPMASNFPLS